MKKITVFETEDGKRFNDEADALEHEMLYFKSRTILDLLGGNNREIDGNISRDFTNGNGYVSISKEKFQEAIELIENLKKWRDLSSYDITNIRCYEDEYLGSISEIMQCIYKEENSNFVKRFGQVYFVSNPNEVKEFEYKKVS